MNISTEKISKNRKNIGHFIHHQNRAGHFIHQATQYYCKHGLFVQAINYAKHVLSKSCTLEWRDTRALGILGVVVVLEQVWLGDVAVMRALMMLVRNEKMLTFYQIYIYIYIYIYI
jgi:hypothetical protein